MANTSDLSKGQILKHNGENCLILDVEFRKPGKGGAFFQVKMKNIKTGRNIEHRFNSGEKIELVRIERHPFQYLYQDGPNFVFMNNETYDQIMFPVDGVSDSFKFIKENENVQIAFEGDTPLSVDVPLHVNLRITFTEPGLKGDTATNALKPATVETGAQVMVPLFINEGDLIRIDTSEASYIQRIND